MYYDVWRNTFGEGRGKKYAYSIVTFCCGCVFGPIVSRLGDIWTWQEATLPVTPSVVRSPLQAKDAFHTSGSMINEQINWEYEELT